MSKECLKESGMSKVLKALDIANKRIDELEKYNLDLANESHNKSLAIERANERVEELEEGIKSSIFEASCFDVDVISCLNTMAYEHNYDDIPRYRVLAKRCVKRINNRASNLNKFAIDKQIEALQKCIMDNSFENKTIDAVVIYVDDVMADIEQLRKGSES